RRKRLKTSQLSDVFGIDLNMGSPGLTPKKPASKTKKPAKKKQPKVEESSPPDKVIQIFTVAHLLDSPVPVKRAIYTLSDGRWRRVKDLTNSLKRRVSAKTLSRRHKVWFYQLSNKDDPSYWLRYAQEQHDAE
ncbi:MAG: hypothetical protein P1V97_11820, partial [Planctomycetota bacterium]|nr:hypothetical protein [Planctomycetota bacterium]